MDGECWMNGKSQGDRVSVPVRGLCFLGNKYISLLFPGKNQVFSIKSLFIPSNNLEFRNKKLSFLSNKLLFPVKKLGGQADLSKNLPIREGGHNGCPCAHNTVRGLKNTVIDTVTGQNHLRMQARWANIGRSKHLRHLSSAYQPKGVHDRHRAS